MTAFATIADARQGAYEEALGAKLAELPEPRCTTREEQVDRGGEQDGNEEGTVS